MRTGGQTNLRSQLIHCRASLAVLLHGKESKWGWGPDRGSFSVHKMIQLSHAHETVVASTFVKVYQKES